jgi:hypothetical protein
MEDGDVNRNGITYSDEDLRRIILKMIDYIENGQATDHFKKHEKDLKKATGAEEPNRKALADIFANDNFYSK